MTSCPWLRERGLTGDALRHFLDAHGGPAAADLAEAVQAAAARVVEETRARPRESLLLAAGIGFVLGIALSSRRS
ncbi:hypothetical protein [Acidisoma sp. C75]